MKLNLNALGIAAVVALAVVGGSASAAETSLVSGTAAVVEETPLPGCVFPYDRPFPWSQHGIVDDAAHTIGLPKTTVCEGLDNGRSLLEIAIAHGVGEERLERGILNGQWADLVHRARATEFTLARAVRHYAELVAHIDVIIRHHG